MARKAEHIELSMGNVAVIGSVAALTGLGGLAAMHWASQRNIPFVSKAARGTADFLTSTTNKG